MVTLARTPRVTLGSLYAHLATAALVIVHVLLYHRFKQPPPPIHATPQFMQSPSASNPLFKQPHLLMQPPRPLFVPCHRPPHHALQGTQAALPYDDIYDMIL